MTRCPYCGGSLPAIDGIRLDRATSTAAWDGRIVSLGAASYRLVETLLDARGAVVPHARLRDSIYDGARPPESRTAMQALMKCVRRRLAGAPVEILSHYGAGYSLRPVAGNAP